ncbi:tetratricopeptide repeat protein [Coraliomargarita sp. W4R53]
MNFLQHPLVLRLSRILTILLILVLLGLLTRPIEAPAWKVVKAGQPEMNLEAIEGALGQGLVVGVLGGFRAILADFLWIRTNTIWERRDRVKLDAMVRLVTTLDPRPEFFWMNGSRMIAYDVPNWRIREEGGYDAVPEVRQQAIDFEQATQAFGLLDEALEFHPDRAKLYLEKGQIYLNRLKDDANAAKWFLKASEQADAPYYAARIYAELLRKQGKNTEAYAFLKDLHRALPNEPYAQKGIILERIGELENTLKIPVWERFQPALEPAVEVPRQAPAYDVPEPHDHAGHAH